jgi:hypothetical protein
LRIEIDLRADRAYRALVDRVLDAVYARVGTADYACFSVGFHLEHVCAHLRAQAASDAEILIDRGGSHGSSFLLE